MQHEVGQTQRARALQRPLEALETLRPRGRVAKAARFLNCLRSRVILTGKAKHGSRHAEAGRARGFRKLVAFDPCRMVRIAASDLHDIDSQPVQQPFQLRHALYLQGPTADPNRQRFDSHGENLLQMIQPPGAGSMAQPSGPSLAPSLSRISWKVQICSTFSSATSFEPVQMTARPVLWAVSMKATARSTGQPSTLSNTPTTKSVL